MGISKRTTQTKGGVAKMRWNSQRLWRHVETDWVAEKPCTPQKNLSRPIRSAHEDKDSTRLWSAHHLRDPSLLLSVFRSRSSGNFSKSLAPTAHVNVWQTLGTSQSLCPFLVMCVALFPERYSRFLSHTPIPVLKMFLT